MPVTLFASNAFKVDAFTEMIVPKLPDRLPADKFSFCLVYRLTAHLVLSAEIVR